MRLETLKIVEELDTCEIRDGTIEDEFDIGEIRDAKIIDETK